MKKNKNEQTNLKKEDRFAAMANGGKKLTAEIPRMEEISPRKINRRLMSFADVDVEKRLFDEQSEYKRFLQEKDDLKKKYLPFLLDYSQAELPLERSLEIKDFLYRPETDEDKTDFSRAMYSDDMYERIVLPHYVGPVGRWNAFYRTEINIEQKRTDRVYLLDFEAVDYIAEVYLNGRMIATHEGFFEPFCVDITPYIKVGQNKLFLVVKNDFTTSGIELNGVVNYGNKIYAETHLGYDEPYLGWHHCPAGLGIFGKVLFRECAPQIISDIFVETDIDSGKICVNTTVHNYALKNPKCKVEYRIEGSNFEQIVIENHIGKCDILQVNENHLKEEFLIPDFRIWSPDEPYLYAVSVILTDENGEPLHSKKTFFGMRKFVMDENSTPKGRFYLNNKPILLYGTNEMGHLPRAVMTGNDEQLLDDILIAKTAHINFYRMTQRPVFKKIYDFFDRTGMLCQTDFPLFSFLTYPAVGEALKQVCAMEKLVRNHPSVILDTFCNETLDKTAWGKEQYVLSRMEMERFFNAAREAVHIYNPQRVIKYNEGDYAPIENTYGISDFHTYTFWYVSHGMPSGKLNKGYLPPIRKDWMTGCGEFGCDGLDRLELLRKYCPAEWLPKNDLDPWSPTSIAKAQCYSLHGDFFPEQNTAEEWISASREHQRISTKQLTHILRRRSDYIESFAIHLLIDAWPCGWTKALVDVDRIPKPAYYAYKEALEPLRISLRRDRYTLYSDEDIVTEVYLLNSLPNASETKINIAVYANENKVDSYSVIEKVNACSSEYIGELHYKVPTDFEGTIEVRAESENGTYDSVEYSIVKPFAYSKKRPQLFGDSIKDYQKLFGNDDDDEIIICDQEYFEKNKKHLESFVIEGGKLILFISRPLTLMGETLDFRYHTLEEEVRANNLIFRSRTSKYTAEFAEMDFKNFYNSDKDYQDLTAWVKFDWDGADEILYTLFDTQEPEFELHKRHRHICAEKKYGKGSIVLTSLTAVNGCVGYNPILDKFLINLLDK